MQTTNEVMSVVDAADTAVRTACVIDLLLESRPLPPFAGEAVDQAIAVLDDALKGSALLTGEGDIQGFSGNLDALSWATDSYIAAREGTSARLDLAEVEELLRNVKNQMEDVRRKITERSLSDAGVCSFDDARRFFDSLAKILSRRATALLTHPSRSYAKAGVV